MSTASGANAQAAGRGGSQESTSNAQAAASGSQGNNQISDPQADPQHSPAEEEHVSLEHVKKVRQENATLRDRLAQVETAQKEAELAKLGELEKTQKLFSDLQEKYATLEADHLNLRLSTQVAKAAQALGFIDYEDAYKMLLTGGELEADKDGTYVNVEKLLEKLAAAKPYLLAGNQPRSVISPTSGGATNPGRSAAPAAQPASRPTGNEMYKQHKERGGLQDPNLWKH